MFNGVVYKFRVINGLKNGVDNCLSSVQIDEVYSLGNGTMCAQLFRRKLVTFGHFSHVNFVHEGVYRDVVLLC